MKKSCRNQGVVIEFNGLPGAGKTTICNALFPILKEHGYTVSNYGEFYSNNCDSVFNRLKNSISHPLSTLHYAYLIVLMLKSSKLNKQMFKYALASIVDFGTFLAFLNQKNISFYLVDQGLVQQWLSIFHTERIHNTPAIEKLFSFLDTLSANYYVVNVNSSIETSILRVNKRKNGSSRIDGLKDADIQRRIQSRESENLFVLRKGNKSTQVIEFESDDIRASVEEIMARLGI